VIIAAAVGSTGKPDGATPCVVGVTADDVEVVGDDGVVVAVLLFTCELL